MNTVHRLKPNRPGLTIGAFSIIKHKQSWPILKMLQTLTNVICCEDKQLAEDRTRITV
nr:MAG TPA: hypothetical protein [Caudoviricetes sp.]